MISCRHCDSAPERREDSASGRVMFICPVCNHRGVATIGEAENYARATWARANDPSLPRHTCGEGAPRFKQREGKWFVACSACSHVTGGFMSIEGAVAGWLRGTRR